MKRLAALLLLAPPAVAMRSDSTKTPSFGMYQGRPPQNLLWDVYPGEIVSGAEERRKSKPK